MFSENFLSQLSQQFESLPDRLGGHIALSMASLLIGILISVPLGILASRRPRLEAFALLLASIVQTIPGLALLALMVFAWGRIGWLPALIALTLYSILPMLRNTITGIHGIDPNLIEAARGVGMSEHQMLWKVQLPLASPAIVAGIRTAAVWVVGAATIAQPVGATSLGNYIFVGLQTMNFTALFFGCVLSASLALAIDSMLHGLEFATSQRNVMKGMAMGTGLCCLTLSPMLLRSVQWEGGQLSLTATQRVSGQQTHPYVVGGKSFTEQYILSRVIANRLRSAGLVVETRDGMGSATVLTALESGEVDCYVDYTGTIWSNYMKRTEFTSPSETQIDVAAYLKDQRQVICMGTLGFSNDYAFAVRRDQAEQLGIKTIADLVPLAAEWEIGGDIEFFDRPEWAQVQAAYGLDFPQKRSMDSTLMYEAIAAGSVDVIVAFSTEGRLDAYNLVVLDDPRFSLPPYDAILLVSRRMARDPAAIRALRPLLEAVSTQAMRHANGIVDVERKSLEDAAQFVAEQLRTR